MSAILVTIVVGVGDTFSRTTYERSTNDLSSNLTVQTRRMSSIPEVETSDESFTVKITPSTAPFRALVCIDNPAGQGGHPAGSTVSGLSLRLEDQAGNDVPVGKDTFRVRLVCDACVLNYGGLTMLFDTRSSFSADVMKCMKIGLRILPKNCHHCFTTRVCERGNATSRCYFCILTSRPLVRAFLALEDGQERRALSSHVGPILEMAEPRWIPCPAGLEGEPDI